MNTIDKRQTIIFYKTAIPIILSVFVIYLTMGIALGVLPELIKNELKFSSFWVGVAIAMQSLATLLTRAYAGKITDTKGAKKSHLSGVILIMFTGVIYCFSTIFIQHPVTALIILILARIFHGMSESMVVTGAATWGIGLAGVKNSGKMMSWIGIAIYGGIIAGAPLGILLIQKWGISSAFPFIVILPLVSLLLTSKLPIIPFDNTHVRKPFYKVVRSVAKYGFGLTLSSIGYGCLLSFIALFFMSNNWGNPSLAFLTFGIFYVMTRVFFSSSSDKYGGYIVALISLIIETIGQILMGFPFSKAMVIVGCGLTGIGSSLVYPALGVLAIKKVDTQMRGTALGAYAAFVDLALAVAGPLGGLIAGWLNYHAVYLFGGICCLLAIATVSHKRN